jgi:putative transposase
MHERRDQLVHPAHAKPELIATAPNQVWSWDITRLRSTLKWQHFYLYVLLDIFSRYVVGWLVASNENAGLAGALIEETCDKYGIARDTLTLHSDRGSPMRAKTTAELLVDLGVAASHSRPRVSNDTRSRRHSSRRSNTGPSSPSASTGSNMRALTCVASSPGTTTSTAAPASAS